MPRRVSHRRANHSPLLSKWSRLGTGKRIGKFLSDYLSSEHLRAKGFYISLILAAPRLVGVLRLGTPLWIEKVGDPRKFSIATFLISAVFLLTLAVVGTPGVLSAPQASLMALVLLWTTYHFFEFLGVVSLWAWIGETVPSQVRGRFIGERGAILNICQVASMILSGWGNFQWKEHCNDVGKPEQIWYGYVLCATAGALLMATAVWPLIRATLRAQTISGRRATASTSLRDIFKPFGDAGFRRFLFYGVSGSRSPTASPICRSWSTASTS